LVAVKADTTTAGCGTVAPSMSTARPAPLPPNPLLSVVMPVYNERTTVEEIIRRVLAIPLRIELIVVDDGSKDGSGEILDRLATELGFKLLRQANAGKGAALRNGFSAVTGDLVVIQDADLE
jgi:glycosyltransferase involved in cell wall biosynthesis